MTCLKAEWFDDVAWRAFSEQVFLVLLLRAGHASSLLDACSRLPGKAQSRGGGRMAHGESRGCLQILESFVQGSDSPLWVTSRRPLMFYHLKCVLSENLHWLQKLSWCFAKMSSLLACSFVSARVRMLWDAGFWWAAVLAEHQMA